MLARALLVFLVVMNLGVGLWWLFGTTTPVAASVVTGDDVPTLQLVSERLTTRAPAGPTGRNAALPADAACISLGPFTDAAAASAAAERLPALRTRVSERTSGRRRGWRVLLPPQPSAEAAQALGARVAAAGFRDYFVMRDGVDANAIALGRFQSEQAARRHAAAVSAAGFPARVEPPGGGAATVWLDLALAPDADPDAVQLSMGVSEQRPIDCELLR